MAIHGCPGKVLTKQKKQTNKGPKVKYAQWVQKQHEAQYCWIGKSWGRRRIGGKKGSRGARACRVLQATLRMLAASLTK